MLSEPIYEFIRVNGLRCFAIGWTPRDRDGWLLDGRDERRKELSSSIVVGNPNILKNTSQNKLLFDEIYNSLTD